MKCFIVLLAVLALSQAKSFNKGKFGFEKTESSDLSFGNHFDVEAFNGWYGKQQEFTWEKPTEQATEFYHYLIHFGVSQEYAVAIVEKVFQLPATTFVKDVSFATPEGKFNFFDKYYWQQKGQYQQVYQVLDFLRQHGVIGNEAFNYFYQYYQPEDFFGKHEEYQPTLHYNKHEKMPFFYGKHQAYEPLYNNFYKQFYYGKQGFQPSFYKHVSHQPFKGQEFYGPYNTQFYHQQQYQHQYPEFYNNQYQHQYPEFYNKQYHHQTPELYNKQYQHQYPEFYQQYQHQTPEFYNKQYQHQFPEFYQQYQHQYPEYYNKQYQHQTPEFYNQHKY